MRWRPAGRRVLLDGREIDPSPDGVRTALARSLDPGGRARLGELPGLALLVDHYEQLTPTDPWMRRELLPELPADALTVLAGRDAPDPAWRRIPGWRELGTVLRLDGLNRSREQRVPAPVAASPPSCTPALLPLVPRASAGAGPAGRRRHEGELSQRSSPTPPTWSPRCSRGSSARCPARPTPSGWRPARWPGRPPRTCSRTPSARAAPEVWDWLARQPYVARGPRGLILHDLARDVLTAELERRSPERQRRLHRIVHDRVVAEIRATSGPDRQHPAQQLLFLHRHSPLTSTFWTLRSRGSAAVVPGAAGGPCRRCWRWSSGSSAADSAALARRLARGWRPRGCRWSGSPAASSAFALGLLLPDRLAPGAARTRWSARAGARRPDGRRPGPASRSTSRRFMGGAQEYERDPYAVLVASVAALTTWLTRPLAWSFTAPPTRSSGGRSSTTSAWTGSPRWRSADGRPRFYGMDWRRLPPDSLDGPDERPGADRGHRARRPPTCCGPAPLGREAFAAAVRTALRDLHRDDRLRREPAVRHPGWRWVPTGRRGRAARSEPRAGGGRPRPAAARRGAAPRARPDLPPAGPDPGGRGGGPRACRSAPTAGTWPPRSTTWSSCSGPSRSARSCCRDPDRRR